MAAMVAPHFEALSSWAGQGGFGGNLTVVDKVPAEMLHLVDPHWYQFPPMNPLVNSTEMAVFGCRSKFKQFFSVMIFLFFVHSGTQFWASLWFCWALSQPSVMAASFLYSQRPKASVPHPTFSLSIWHSLIS